MKILAIGAHPDDIELFCGGTLLRAKEEGYEVRAVVCTKGEQGGKDRITEQEKAWEFMQIENCKILDFPDEYVLHNKDLVSVLDEIIKDYKPNIIFSHSEVDPHQDHIAVARAVRSTNRTWAFNWITYCPYDLRSVFVPNFFVNIDDYYEKKKELLKVFVSQKDRWYFKESVLSSRSMGTNIAKYVEPFRIEFGFIQ